MSFLHPALLWALPLAAAPLVIHLLFRWRHRPVVFSDLVLLAEAAARTMPRRRLEEWLLVAVRCALAALLVAFFARPLLHWGLGGPPADEKTGMDVVILLDASYSMGAVTQGRSRFERAKQVAATVLASLRPQDRAAVVAFSDRIEGSSGELDSGKERLLPWLERASPSWHGTDYRLALESAFSILSRSASGRKAVVVLSDNARHGWRSLKPADTAAAVPFFDPKVRLAGLAWPDAPGNAAVEPARLEGETLAVPVTLWGRPSADTDLTVVRGGRPTAKTRAALKRGVNMALFQLGASTGALTGRVEARPDALAADDASHFAFTVRERPRVLALEAASRELPTFQGGYFLKRAFQSALFPLEASFADPADLPRARLEGIKAVIVLSPEAVDGAGAARLEAFVRDGGGLWVVPDGRAGAGPALGPVLPARIAGPSGAGTGLRVEAAGALLGLPFRWAEFDLEKVSFDRAFRLEPKEGAETWFRTGRGDPALVAGRLGRGLVMVSAAPFQPSWSNLPLKPVFPALVSAALLRLTRAAGPAERQNLRLEEVFTHAWQPEAAPLQAVITGPDRMTHRLPVLDGRIQFARTDLPGLYDLRAEGPAGREETAFAVNLDPALQEGDLQGEPDVPWTLIGEARFAEDLYRLLFGREVRHYALAGLLLLLVAESLLMRKP